MKRKVLKGLMFLAVFLFLSFMGCMIHEIIRYQPDNLTFKNYAPWEEETFTQIFPQEPTARLIEDGTQTQCVAFSPDGKWLVSGHKRGIVRFWDLALEKQIAVLRHSWPTPVEFLRGFSVNSLDFSPDGKLLASGIGGWSHDGEKTTFFGTVHLWDVASQKEIATFKGHWREVVSVAFSPNGKLLASGSWDNTIRLWDVDLQKEVATFRAQPNDSDPKFFYWDITEQTEILSDHSNQKRISGITAGVSCIAFSPDGNLLVSGHWDGTMHLWDVGLRNEVAIVKGHRAGVRSIAFSPDGKLLASGSSDSVIRLWDLNLSKRIRNRYPDSIGVLNHSSPVQSLAFFPLFPHGNLLASGNEDGTVHFWDLSPKKEVAVLRGHTDVVNDLVFSPNGRWLISAGKDGTLLLWDLGTEKPPKDESLVTRASLK